MPYRRVSYVWEPYVLDANMPEMWEALIQKTFSRPHDLFYVRLGVAIGG